jgi:fructose-1,6-bisphosphatase/inositol monophosphatase family enzyme
MVVEVGLQPYDYLSLVPVIQGAGGIITDWNGHRLGLHSDGRVVAAATADLHAEALAALQASR